MQTHLPKVDKRKRDKASKNAGIINFDEDNQYPDRTIDYISSSGTATACVNLFGRFVRGQGFADPNFYKSRVNRKGLRVDQLLRLLVDDYKKHKGFCFHVNLTMLGNITEVNYIPFDKIRMGDTKNAEYAGRFAWSDCWSERAQKDIVWYYGYNPKPDVIIQQVEKAGSVEAYTGQLFYYSESVDCYPLSSIDAVKEDVIADSKIKNYRMNIASRGFMAEGFLEVSGFRDDETRENFLGQVEEFQGGDNAGKVMVVENDNPQLPIKFTPAQATNNDKTFTVTNETCKNSIIQQFNQPLALLTTIMPSNFGAPQIRDSFDFYNSHTFDDRLIFEETFKEVFSRWYFEINMSNDYSILPLSFGALNAEKPPLISTIGVGGTTSLITILQTEIPRDKKINIISQVFGIDFLEASKMV